MPRSLFFGFGAMLVLAVFFLVPKLLETPGSKSDPTAPMEVLHRIQDTVRGRTHAVRATDDLDEEKPEVVVLQDWSCSCNGKGAVCREEKTFASMTEATQSLRAHCGEDCVPNCFVNRREVQRETAIDEQLEKIK